MSKPVFICLPEAAHSARIYDSLRFALSPFGYVVISLDFPSIGGNLATYDFTQDVQAIRATVSQVANSGADIIMVFHGYAGLPGSEALLGLSKRERELAGMKGGVVRLVFIMAYIATEGFRASTRGDVTSMPPYVRCNLQTNVLVVDPEDAIPAFYNDLPEDQARYLVSQLLPQSIGVYWSRTTYAAWRYIPSTFVLCGKDQTMPMAYAEIVLNAARLSRPNMIDVVEKCEAAGHFVMLSQPEWTANMLRRAAGEQL